MKQKKCLTALEKYAILRLSTVTTKKEEFYMKAILSFFGILAGVEIWNFCGNVFGRGIGGFVGFMFFGMILMIVYMYNHPEER